MADRKYSALQQPMWPAIAGGLLLSAIFYAALLSPIGTDFLRRYCMSHPVAFQAVTLFFCALVVLIRKGLSVRTQRRKVSEGSRALTDLLATVPAPKPSDICQWLLTMWSSQTAKITDSWLGGRLVRLLDRQSQRESSEALDHDLRDLAEADADTQFESYGFVRIVNWAMPMLGFLGTVLGISKTLGQMDTQSLASGSQDAMNELTAGLYVAFDTTAIALVLTVATMFLQFVVQKSESSVLESVNAAMGGKLIKILTREKRHVSSDRAEQLIEQLADNLGQTMQQVVQKQAELWKSVIDASHSQWDSLTTQAQSTITDGLRHGLTDCLASHAERLASIQSEGARHVEHRWKQWQTTLSEQSKLLSDQSKSIQSHQAEVAKQTELLCSLLSKQDQVERLEQQVERSLQRLTDVDRFSDAAVCLTEAVAVLGTHLERRGMIGKQKQRRTGRISVSGTSSNVEKGIEREQQHRDPSFRADERPATLPISSVETSSGQAKSERNSASQIRKDAA